VHLLGFRERGLPWEVNVYEDQRLGREGLEGFCGKHLIVQLDTGRAPVRAMKLDQEDLIFLLCLGYCRVIIGEPVFAGSLHGGSS
jgi:hypothetical protein